MIKLTGEEYDSQDTAALIKRLESALVQRDGLVETKELRRGARAYMLDVDYPEAIRYAKELIGSITVVL